MDELALSWANILLGGIIGAIVAALASHFSALRLLTRQVQAQIDLLGRQIQTQTYSDLANLVQELMSMPAGTYTGESVAEINRTLHKTYAQLVLFGSDDDVREFVKILDKHDPKPFQMKVSEFVIALRKKYVKETRLTPQDLSSFRVIDLKIDDLHVSSSS